MKTGNDEDYLTVRCIWNASKTRQLGIVNWQIGHVKEQSVMNKGC